MKTFELLNFGSDKLKQLNILSHRLDAEILLSKVLNKDREDILINLQKELKMDSIFEFNNLIKRRLSREPIAYITAEKEFWSKIFNVNYNTLIPRPETELLVDKLVNIFKNKKINILDVGTGSGCIIISLLGDIKNSKGIGIDISNNALKIAKKNAEKHNMQNKVKFLNKSISDLFNYKFDLIVSDPPYIAEKNIKNLDDDIKKYEPLIALNGGNDGLDVIKKVIYKAKYILKINGTLAIEISNEQYKKVSSILKRNNFRIKYYIKDYKENIRCLISNLIK